MGLSRAYSCEVRAETPHKPMYALDRSTTVLKKSGGLRRYLNVCMYCMETIFSDVTSSHPLTRDIRVGAWYTEDYIINEWP